MVPAAGEGEVDGDQRSQAGDTRGEELPMAEALGVAGPSGTAARDVETIHTPPPAAGCSPNSADQSILSGEARKQIRDKLAIKKCISYTCPEYAMYLPKLSVSGKRELCCISKSLEILDQMARQLPVPTIPKWLPKVYLSASSKALLERAGDLVRDIQAQEPIFEASNSKNLPASGFN